jgi:RNA polymerase sigma-70 factor, ECF subfamily
MQRLTSIIAEPVNVQEPNRARNEPSPDAVSFARFLSGEDASFMQLFDRHTHRLYLYCLKFLGDREAAEDIVQDLWERVIKLRTTPRDAPDNVLAFLYRIARNLCLNYRRDHKMHASIEGLTEYEHPQAASRELSQHEELVIAALPRLPIAHREVLILNAYAGYRFDEIAEMLGEPVGAIRTRAWRARAQLGRIISALIALDESGDEERPHRRDDDDEQEPMNENDR